MKIRLIPKSKKPAKDKKPSLFTHLHLARQDRPAFADSLRFPDSLADLPPAAISDLIGKYTVLMVYAQQDLAEISRDLIRIDYEERNALAEMLVQRPQLNTIPKHQRDGVIETSPSIRFIRKRQTEALLRKEHTVMFVNRFQSFVNALSRDLSRRSISDRAV